MNLKRTQKSILALAVGLAVASSPAHAQSVEDEISMLREQLIVLKTTAGASSRSQASSIA